MMTMLGRLQDFMTGGDRAVKAAERQFGVIPYMPVGDRVAFLLITSRRSGRWIFPKGAPAKGVSEWDHAAEEARQEAGVTGRVDSTPIGSYRDWKTRSLRRVPIEVFMFPLRVEQQLESWPEEEQRHRHWAIFPEARRLLTNPSLVEMIARIDESVRRERSA
ncbi:MAG: NUDIX hydrolase [Alphaproteobacteria bacterium]